MTDAISLRYPNTTRVDGYGTSEVHPPYPAQERTAAWMHAHLDAHRDVHGVIDTRSLFRAAMQHGVSRATVWCRRTRSERRGVVRSRACPRYSCTVTCSSLLGAGTSPRPT